MSPPPPTIASTPAPSVEREGRRTVNPAFVRPPEATPLVGDPTRAETELGWTREVGCEAMVAEMVQADVA